MKSDLISRRGALAIGGSFALAAALQLKGLAAAETEQLIDAHHHYFPPAWMAKRKQEIIESGGARFYTSPWTPQADIEAMDKAGCRTSLVTCGGPGVWNGDVESSRVVAHEVNDFG